MSRYHASTWPLMLSPAPAGMLYFLKRDYGLGVTAADEELVTAFRAAGHEAVGAYFQTLLSHHSARRYEAQTGLPF